MEPPGLRSPLSPPQQSVEHSNRSSAHPATDLHPRLHPESNESGTERWRGWGGRGGEETGMVWQMCIQIYHASSGCEETQRKEGAEHIEWFRIPLKPVGLERAFMQRNDGVNNMHVRKIHPLKLKQHFFMQMAEIYIWAAQKRNEDDFLKPDKRRG